MAIITRYCLLNGLKSEEYLKLKMTSESVATGGKGSGDGDGSSDGGWIGGESSDDDRSKSSDTPKTWVDR